VDGHVRAEPSTGPIGLLAYDLTETVTGPALACLYTADLYHHVETEIRPQVAAGRVVISDRYLPSGLVMRRFDNVDPVFLWQLYAYADRPDLTVILHADPETIAQRLRDRGPHNRFQRTPGSSHAETYFYQQTTERLMDAGFTVLLIDCTERPPERSAALIREHLLAIAAQGEGHDMAVTCGFPSANQECRHGRPEPGWSR
jgi:dTMP kinase